MLVTFCYSLAGGMLAILSTGRIEQVSWRFLQLIGLLVFAVLCGPIVWTLAASQSPVADALNASTVAAALAAAGAVALALLAPFHAKRPTAIRALAAGAGVAGLIAAAISALQALSATELPAAAPFMVVVDRIVGGLLIGSMTVAWLLGHAYLTATSMTIAPLRHYSRAMRWTILARIAFILVSLVVAWWLGLISEGNLTAQLANAWLFVSLRIGLGIVAVAVFVYMIEDCVRLRATQSATGILYFGSLFAYVGELSSQQLLREVHWPL